jgi:hypothetical protein
MPVAEAKRSLSVLRTAWSTASASVGGKSGRTFAHWNWFHSWIDNNVEGVSETEFSEPSWIRVAEVESLPGGHPGGNFSAISTGEGKSSE